MKTRLFLAAIIFGISFGCQNEDENGTSYYSFSGKAQKGPFITGTTINLNELNANLGQTGRSFTTTISSDDGSFSLENIELQSDLVLLTANGYFFSEIYGELSSSPISLQAIVDLSDRETVNINILTHLIKGRIEQLVSEGESFAVANDQAKSEMLGFLGISETFDKEFTELDLFGVEEQNAALLAFSIMLQRFTLVWNEKPSLVAELTQLLTGLGSDLKDNGQIDDQSLIETLLNNISQLNYLDIRDNLESRLTELDQPVTIPEFETYLSKFMEEHDAEVHTSFYYPDFAPPEPVMAPESELQNLLSLNDSVFEAGHPYSLAAITPLNASLKIRFISYTNTSQQSYYLGGQAHGWEVIDDFPNGFIFISQRQNRLMTVLLGLASPGTATIEYYENVDDTPTISRNIKWE